MYIIYSVCLFYICSILCSVMLYLFTVEFYIIIICMIDIISLDLALPCLTAYLHYTILSAAVHGYTTQYNIIMDKLYCHYCNGIQTAYRRRDSVVYNRIRYNRAVYLYCTYYTYNECYVRALFSEKLLKKHLLFISHYAIL